MLTLLNLFMALICAVEYPVKSAGPSYLQACTHKSTLCPVSNAQHRLHIILDRLPGHLAPCACAAHKMKLASISDDNLEAITGLVNECLGDFQDLWIHAWDGQNYEGIGLTVRSEKNTPLKAIPRHNDQPAQVICVEHF